MTWAWGDYDNDGYLDLFTVNGYGHATPNGLGHNHGGTNGWLKVRLVGGAPIPGRSNQDGSLSSKRAVVFQMPLLRMPRPCADRRLPVAVTYAILGTMKHTVACLPSLLLALGVIGSSLAWSQDTAPPKPAPDAAAYEKYRAWVGVQPREAREAPDLFERYRAILLAEGETPSSTEEQLRLIHAHGRRLEVERWNRILTAPEPKFNTKPNAFLVEMLRGLSPGKALDVGMGQGRNALYLAEQGWDVTGFDPAAQAVAAAQTEAVRLGLKLTTQTVSDEEFDFGKAQWDLVVLSYVSLRHLVPRVHDSLKPGGRVVIEGFHRDATKTHPIGGGVVFDTNELLRLFRDFRILRYEDVQGIGDFGRQETRIVRLCAQKP